MRRRPKRRAPLDGHQKSPPLSSHSPQSATHQRAATSSARNFVSHHCAHHHLVRIWPLALIALSLMISWFSAQQLASGFMLASDCLANCQCSWKSGKFVADCSALNLTKVPKNDYFDHLPESSSGENRMSTLNRDIQALNLSSNQIGGRLSSMEFAQKKFKNLQKIQLDGNQLQHIEAGAFYKLTGLIELDLSDNQLEELLEVASAGIGSERRALELNGRPPPPPLSGSNRILKNDDTLLSSKHDDSAGPRSFLQDLVQLRHLNMNSNRLQRIGSFAFSPMIQLRQLYLSRNNLQSIDKRAFDGLNELNILHLDGNKLTYLNGEILLRLPQLHALQLAENKWRCDCRLRKLVRLLLHKPGPRGAPNLTILQDEPRCHHLAWGPQETDQPTRRRRGRRRRRRRRQANDLDDGTIQRPNLLDNAESERSNGTAPTTTTTTTTSLMGGESIRSTGPIVSSPLSNGQRRVAKNQLETAAVEATAKHQMSNFAMGSGAQRGQPKPGPVRRRQWLSRTERGVLVSADQDDDHQDRHGRLWSSLALDDFECAPQLAADYLGAKVELEDEHKLDATTNNGLNDNWPEPTPPPPPSVGPDGNEQSDDGDKGAKSGAQREAQPHRPTIRSITLERQRVSGNEPIELTCPIGLVDELDVGLTRVEWLLQFQRPSGDHKQPSARLIWRSIESTRNGTTNQSQNQQSSELRQSDGDDSDKQQQQQQRLMIMMKLETKSGGRKRAGEHDGADDGELHYADQRQRLAATSGAAAAARGLIGHGDKFAIIDYVTRANGSKMAAGHREDADTGQEVALGNSNSNNNNNNNNNNGPNESQLVRLVHLIVVEPKATVRSKQIWFLCRVSNLAGQLDVWQPVELAAAGDESDASEAHSSRWRPYEMASENLANVGNQLEELLLESGSGGSRKPPASDQNSRSAPDERVRLQLEREFATLAKDNNNNNDNNNDDLAQLRRPLFLPLSVTPRRLLASLSLARQNQSTSTNGNDQIERADQMAADSLERSLVAAMSDSSSIVRPTKSRQTSNMTSGAPGEQQEARETVGRNRGRGVGLKAMAAARPLDEVTMETNENENDDKGPSGRSSGGDAADRDHHSDSLQQAALDLIGRFTSGRRSLIADWKRNLIGATDLTQRAGGSGGDGRQVLQLELESRSRQASLGQLLADAWRRPGGGVTAKLGELYQIFSLKLAETRRSSFRFSPLAQVVAGLLAGCLLTLAILFKLNACGRRQDKSKRRPFGALDKSCAGGSDGEQAQASRDDSAGGVGKLANVKLRRKIAAAAAAAECSAEVMKCKSNSTLPLGIDGRRRYIKSNERDGPNGSESDEAGDYANDGRDQERESGDGLHSRYGNNQRPAPASPQTLSLVSCRAGGGHHSNRDHNRTATAQNERDQHEDQDDGYLVASVDGRHQQPPGPSGSTGSTTTTTNGSQRLLLPAVQQTGTLLRGCAAGRQSAVNLFASLPRESAQTMHKSKTVQNFVSQDNYERLMGANHCARPTANNNNNNNNNNANHQLDDGSSLDVWCSGGQMLDENKFSTLQRSNQRARTRRNSDQRQQILVAANGIQCNNKRTVTWLMSNESLENGPELCNGLQELAPDQLERSQALRVMNLGNFNQSDCSGSDNNGDSAPNWTTESIRAQQQRLAAAAADSRQGAVQQSCCWTAQSNGPIVAQQSGPLFAMTSVAGGTQLGSSMAPTDRARQQSLLIGGDSVGFKKLELLDDCSEIRLLPACLCVNSNGGGGANNRELNNELVLDSDESYHLYGMFSTYSNSDQSCCNRPTTSNSTTTSTLGTATNTNRPVAEIAHDSSQQHFHQLLGSSLIASPNATISTSSTSTGHPAASQPMQRKRRRRPSQSGAGHSACGPPPTGYSQLDDALALLQNSLDQCEQVDCDPKTKGLNRWEQKPI